MSRAGWEEQYWREQREAEQAEVTRDERERLGMSGMPLTLRVEAEALIAWQTERVLAKQEGRLPAWTSMRAVAAQVLDFDVDYIKAAWDLNEYAQWWFQRAWGIEGYEHWMFTPLGQVEDQAMHLLFLAAAAEVGDLELGD